ncbi:MAG: YncE family protein [Alphaproteobacteria bacterium]|nr:YncE family protein [Alphaproteobacteria bacterium]
MPPHTLAACLLFLSTAFLAVTAQAANHKPLVTQGQAVASGQATNPAQKKIPKKAKSLKKKHRKNRILPMAPLPVHAASVLPPSPETPKSYTDTTNVYAQTGASNLNFDLVNTLPRVYVPNHSSNTVTVINSTTKQVVTTLKVGRGPQHVIPSWDLKTLWVANNADRSTKGSMTQIDPWTGKAGQQIKVDDPYNMYFTPDGKSAIIVDEAYRQLDFRDPQTMALQSILPLPECQGVNHADFAADNSYAIFTCEFGGGALAKVDIANKKLLGILKFSKKGIPQDIRLSADGKVFYVADMLNNGVFTIDGDKFVETGFFETGVGAHGFTVSRDGKKLFISNRGSNNLLSGPRGKGSISVLDFATGKIVANWPIPGGGSPDMGNVTADGKTLWLAGRFDHVVYAIDTTTGQVTKVPVQLEPHGLTVWPQPGRYSQGHTGNMR